MLPAAAGIKAYYFSLRGGALRGVTPLVRAEAKPCIFLRLSPPHCARFRGHTLGMTSSITGVGDGYGDLVLKSGKRILY